MTTKKMYKKTLCTYAMVVMYSLWLFFSFTMLILQEWQQIHYQNQLKQTDNFYWLHFTAKEWEAMDNKREFKINDTYYDVKAIIYEKTWVKAKVVKDNLENEIRLLLTQSFQKHKSIPAHKKKNLVLSVHEPTSTQWEIKNSSKILYANSTIINKKSICTWLLTQQLLRPPC